jgi:hypothetical protein
MARKINLEGVKVIAGFLLCILGLVWAGGPPFVIVCVHHFERGCPILAFFARVGGCVHWVVRFFSGVINTLRRHSSLPPFANAAKDGAPTLLVVPARSTAWATRLVGRSARAGSKSWMLL